MAIAASDLLVVNRDGIDYRAPAIELSAIITRYIGNGNLIIKDWEGTTVAKFTANQGTETTVTLPKGFSGSWNDLADKPDVFPPDNDLVDIPLGQLNDVNADGNDGDYFAKLADGTHGFITPPVIGAAVISLTDGSGNAVGQFNVNQVNNQGIQIPTFSGNYLDLINKPTIGDGSIEINAGSGLTASGPNATANQTGDTIRTLSVKTGNGIIIDANGNVIIDPSYNLDGNITPPGNGTLTVKNYDGTTATTFTANQETATTVNLPKGFSGSYNDLTDKPAINDGKITINNYDGSEVGTFTVNQSANTTIALPEVKIPESLHPMGFIDVSQPAPANPVHGDIYIQHRNDLTDVVASASFAGLAGRTVKEAQFVMFGVDDLWHAGGDAMPTDVQSDWAQTDTTDAAFILNKPATFPPSSHVHSYNDLTDKPTIGNGALTIKNSNGSVAGTFTANQVGATDITLPAGFSGNYNDLTNKPDINNGTLTIKNATGSVVGTFTANQAGDVNIQLPQTKWDDIDGTPTTFPPSAHQHALDDLSDVNADSSKGYVLATLDDGTFGFVPPADLPTAFHPLGFANVGEPCPKADPAPGDLYIHHDPNITRSEYSADDSVIADASWAGIAGETIYEGEYVVFSTDGLWHRGGGVHGITQVQSDWNETDAASLAFIKNKPDVDNFPEAPDTGWLYVRNGLTESWVRGLPYDISSLDPLS